MKEILSKKALFIIFFILILLINLALPQTLNYQNVLIQSSYNHAVEKGRTPEISEAEMLDNKSKVDNFGEFLKKSRILLFSISIIFFVIFLVVDMSKIDIAKIFLLISIPIGLLYIFIVPIGGAPDEQAHWFRSYEVSLGHIFSDKDDENHGGRVLPSEIKSVITDDHISMGPVTEGEEFIEFSNTSLYSAVCYLPQAIGIVIGRCFPNSLVLQCYLARLFNFLMYIIIMWYSIRKIPFKKMALLIIAFLPITFQEVTSLSIDGMQIAFSTLLISYTLYLTFDKSEEKLKLKDFIILLISSIFTAITKFVYLPLCLIIYILPKDKFKNNKKKYILLTTIFIIVTIFDVVLMLNSLNYNNRIAQPNADAVEQLKFILKNPFSFLYVIFLTIQDFAIEHTFQLFGQGLSWLDVDISPIYIISLFIITIYFLYLENSNQKKMVIENDNENIEESELNEANNSILDKNLIKNKKEMKLITRCFIGIIAIGTTFGIALTEYLTIAPVGHKFIIGIQGRYYIPILIFFGSTFAKNLNTENKISKIECLLMFIIFANLNALINIMFSYL